VYQVRHMTGSAVFQPAFPGDVFWRLFHCLILFKKCCEVERDFFGSVSRPIVGSDDSCDLVSWFSSSGCFALSRAISWRSRFIEEWF
jgi:hypothetical protein